MRMSTVIFNVDPKIKARAMKRAKVEGVPFSVILKMATKAFADGQLSLELEEEIRPEKLKLLEQQSRLIEQGKGKTFSTMKEFREYIKKL